MKPLSILLVDDDGDDKDIFCEVLAEINPHIHCVWAKNGYEALNMMKEGENLPIMIFLDLNMPGINGKQCLTKIKGNKDWSGIPVYIFTTSKLKQDIDETLKLGAAAFITKPATFQDLKLILGQICKF